MTPDEFAAFLDECPPILQGFAAELGARDAATGRPSRTREELLAALHARYDEAWLAAST